MTATLTQNRQAAGSVKRLLCPRQKKEPFHGALQVLACYLESCSCLSQMTGNESGHVDQGLGFVTSSRGHLSSQGRLFRPHHLCGQGVKTAEYQWAFAKQFNVIKYITGTLQSVTFIQILSHFTLLPPNVMGYKKYPYIRFYLRTAGFLTQLPHIFPGIV